METDQPSVHSISLHNESTPLTPRTPSEDVLLALTYGQTTWRPRVFQGYKQAVEAQFSTFVSSIDILRDDEAINYEIQTSFVLAAEFLGYLNHHDNAGWSTLAIFEAFRQDFLSDRDIHSVSLTLDSLTQKRVLQHFYAVKQRLASNAFDPTSAILERAWAERETLFGIYGGQGPANTTCLQELRDLYQIYGQYLDELLDVATEALEELACRNETGQFFAESGFDIRQWVENKQTAPESRIYEAPFSFPLIGLLSLAHYCVACKVVGKEPSEINSAFKGVTGHSQGIVAAVATARSTDWSSFYQSARTALEILFWIGFECSQSMQFPPISLQMVDECISAGEGSPTPMLSARGLHIDAIQNLLDGINIYLPEERRLYISLINALDSVVVAGPPQSLCSLCARLRGIKAGDGLDQSKVVFNQRKPKIHYGFLPMSSAFHCPYSDVATQSILMRLRSVVLCGNDLNMSVYHTCTGEDLKQYGTQSLVPCLVKMITAEIVDWPRATVFEQKCSVIDFGPGSLGSLAKRAKDGSAVRVICASELNRSEGLGCKADLFSTFVPTAKSSWEDDFKPCLRSTETGTAIETRMSRLFGVPPIMVAGMTPTTVPWDFVASIIKAGYHAELACGGYSSASHLEKAIINLSRSIPPTTGITCNIIYASPKTVGWQIPLIRDMVKRGYPIQGLTVGAGIPSAETVKEYIETLGLKHISFKPGSTESIRQVIAISKTHPKFPIGLQWTGGRAGGHHSFEDFHAPILETYSQIRRCDNIVLIAGSGFGGADDTFPYLSGGWSNVFGRAAMPFDGVLFGSRMMVAKEAHTSIEAKALIVGAPGVTDSEWHTSYVKPTGGIITVQSEMGQPIHTINTRGMMLWNELDQKIFKISDRSKRLDELQKNRDWIIKRLIKDFQKPWFAVDGLGQAIELEDMTYTEVLHRLVNLMYVGHQQRWIDLSYRTLVADFSQRLKDRFVSVTPMSDVSLDDPMLYLENLFASYPDALTESLHPEDIPFFLGLCRRRGQKPINFIPALNEDFETWFKKDSLWQAEDVDALPEQDVQRACIIHGPVAASHSTAVDEPVGSILDDIHSSHIRMLQERKTEFTGVDSDHTVQLERRDTLSSITLGTPRFSFPNSRPLPDVDSFRDDLCSNLSGWALDIVREDSIRQGHMNVPNPMRAAFVPVYGHEISIEFGCDRNITALVMTRMRSSRSKPQEIIRIDAGEESDRFTLRLFAPNIATNEVTSLSFFFKYSSQPTFTKIEEDTVGRNKRIKSFYAKLWSCDDQNLEDLNIAQPFVGEKAILSAEMVREFTASVGSSSIYEDSQDAPLDICIVLVWEVLVKPLLAPMVECDLLRLLHRSNEFRYVRGAQPLKIGDVLESSSRVQSITIQKGDKVVEVLAEITRDGVPVVEVLSKFFCKGPFSDYEGNMIRIKEPQFKLFIKSEIESALLTSRKWLKFDSPIIPGETIYFEIESNTTHSRDGTIGGLHVTGDVTKSTASGFERIGRIELESSKYRGNPVLDFLNRHGEASQKQTNLSNPGLESKSVWNETSLVANTAYARVSKDANPIHVSAPFAHYAQLPGIINHGMGTSALVLRSIERAVADCDHARIRRYSASFEGMVLPGDQLEIEMQHTGMKKGMKIMKITARSQESGTTVLEAEADIEQPPTTYVFTGQGSQEKGMGMKLYESSPAARALWDKADKTLYETYGFSILDIVRNDPKTLTIHFGGAKGRKIRDNFLSLTIDRVCANGEVIREPIVKGLNANSRSYTFSDPRGLLYSTQFAQPAITLMEMSRLVDLESKGMLQQEASYAGHSLGEYSALGAVAGVISMEAMVRLVFYRGLAMQTAIQRDTNGRTEFSMMAANPSRVSKTFDQKALCITVDLIANETGVLLEIVNFNVQGRQYVCAGHLRALWTLTAVLDTLAKSKTNPVYGSDNELLALVKDCAEASLDVPEPIELQRGTATIPLRGIDVPFHSRHLRDGIPAYRRYLESQILEENIDVNRLRGFIPNVTAKPFSTDRAYVEETARITDSDDLRDLLEHWDEL